MTNTMTVCAPEKFHNAEQLWFWFIYSKSLQPALHHMRGAATKRPCELLDVETMVTKLYLCGKLTAEQLSVMKTFGDRRRAPHQHIWAENCAAMLWNQAMDTITVAANERGWLC